METKEMTPDEVWQEKHKYSELVGTKYPDYGKSDSEK
jgi:hypothetical protein